MAGGACLQCLRIYVINRVRERSLGADSHSRGTQGALGSCAPGAGPAWATEPEGCVV